MQRYSLNMEKFYFWICNKENKGLSECVSKVSNKDEVSVEVTKMC